MSRRKALWSKPPAVSWLPQKGPDHSTASSAQSCGHPLPFAFVSRQPQAEPCAGIWKAARPDVMAREGALRLLRIGGVIKAEKERTACLDPTGACNQAIEPFGFTRKTPDSPVTPIPVTKRHASDFERRT